MCIYLSLYIYIYIHIHFILDIHHMIQGDAEVALVAQWLGCQPQEAEVLGSILTTSN